MADKKHLAIFNRGVKTWNAWRRRNPKTKPDLSRALLIDRELRGINLSDTNLERSVLRGTTLSRANLARANLIRADLRAASLRRAKLDHANLTAAILRHTSLAETSVEGTTFAACQIYGIAAWNLSGTPREQSNLIIRASNAEPAIHVDDLEVAQFVYLLLSNGKITRLVDTVGKKAVLILGRFTDERKAVLEALKSALRAKAYLPILFDFEKPAGRDVNETLSLLAHMARFIIADFSDAKSVIQQMQAIVPTLPSVPVQPIIIADQEQSASLTFDFLRRYPWVLKPYRYDGQEQLIASLDEWVIRPAEAKVLELRGTKPG